ncbi:MAG: hypothetical protein L3K18_07845 [Thermoplasmata archaeon]|nr:hypothetical protein [Thermoplasmata archaeon]
MGYLKLGPAVYALGVLTLLLLSSGGTIGGHPLAAAGRPNHEPGAPVAWPEMPGVASGMRHAAVTSLYVVVITETGLPSGTNWTVNLTSLSTQVSIYHWSLTPNVTFSVPNGSYRFTLRPVIGLSPSPPSGNLTVSGAGVTQTVSFVAPPARYEVTFVASGIPVNWGWVVIFNGSQSETSSPESLSFQVVNGTYSYGIGQTGSYTPTPAFGNLTVSGQNLVIAVSFRAPTTYLVSFNETGLAPGTSWQVWLGGATAGSSTPSVVFNMTNGSYAFVLTAGAQPTGYVSANSPGNLTVSGSAILLNVTFVPAPYLLTFSETDLPSNTVFSAWVTGLGGLGQAGVGSFGISVVNGTYAYWVPPVWGYQPTVPTGNVTIGGASVTVNVTFLPQPYTLTFTETGLALATNWTVVVANEEGSTSNASTLSVPIGNGTFPFEVFSVPGYTTGPANGSVTVTGANQSVSITFSSTANATRYAVKFTEVGLPVGSEWSVDLNGTYWSGSGTQITVNLSNNSWYWFQIHGPSDYSAVDAFEDFSVHGSNLTFRVSFFDVVAALYSITFTEHGLPNGTDWTIATGHIVSSSTAASIAITVPNGTYAFNVSTGSQYLPTPAGGTALVSGAGVAISVNFTLGPSPPLYPIEFNESGLPKGANWSVDLGGITSSSSGPTVEFERSNGTYLYSISSMPGYVATPGWGNVTVHGVARVVSIVFASTAPAPPPPVFEITFHENGLPNGTGWGVVIGSAIETSLTNRIAFADEPNGTYGYVVLAISGYSATYSGIATVAGENATINVTFVPLTYPVIIVEFGLASGTNWSVTVSNNSTGFHETRSSTSNTIEFELPNGTYSISVSVPAGYSFSLSTAALTVAGHSPATPSLDATPVSHPLSTGPAMEIALVVGIGVLATVAVSLLAWSRRRPPTPTAAQNSLPRHT